MKYHLMQNCTRQEMKLGFRTYMSDEGGIKPSLNWHFKTRPGEPNTHELRNKKPSASYLQYLSEKVHRQLWLMMSISLNFMLSIRLHNVL